MRPLGADPEPLASIMYRRARAGGGSESASLPVERLRVDAVPEGCRAVLVTGDLQGMASSPYGGNPVLLGVALADYLSVWAAAGLVPDPGKIGVLLTGDLYSASSADVRGASGDVSDVWLAFASAGCAFVVGIAGNHDEISAPQLAAFGPDVRLLDGDRSTVGGMDLAGCGGVVGDPSRPHRRTEAVFLATVKALTTPPPAVLLLHEGPAGDEPAQRGNPAVRALLRRRPPALTVCGHVGWERPLARLGDGHILNVDGRAILLEPASTPHGVSAARQR